MAEAVQEQYVVKTRRAPAVWQSLGSEIEIAEAAVVATRPLVRSSSILIYFDICFIFDHFFLTMT